MSDRCTRPGTGLYSSIPPFFREKVFKKFLNLQTIFWKKEKARWFYNQRKAAKFKSSRIGRSWKAKEDNKNDNIDYKALAFEISILKEVGSKEYVKMLDFDAETDIEDEINIDDENTYNMMNFDLDADFDVVDYNEEDSEKNFMTDEDEENEENEDKENEDDENEDENYLKESLPKNNYSFTLTKQELMSKFWDENLEDILQLPEEEFLQLPEELQKLTKLKIQTLEKG